MDELPQIFWNILVKGNMSVIGPRPILRDELERHYTKEEQEKYGVVGIEISREIK